MNQTFFNNTAWDKINILPSPGKPPINVTELLLDYSEDFNNHTTSINETRTIRPTTNVIIQGICMCFMWITALISNILVCVVINRSRRLQSTTNYFVVSLACSDLCMTIFCLPFVFIRVILGRWLLGLVMCKLVRYMQIVVPSTTVVVLVSICIDRFYTIIYPLSFKVTRTVAKHMIATSWLISFIISSPSLYFYDVIHLKNNIDFCMTSLGDKWDSLLYLSLLTTVIYILPIIVICISYIRIFRYIWRAGPPGRSIQRTTNPVPRAKVKMVKLIILVNACVLTFMAPYIITQLFYSFNHGPKVDPVIYITVLCIYFSTCIMKPVIYLTLNSNFRRGCKEVLCMSTMKCYRHNVYSITSMTKVGRRNHIGVAQPDNNKVYQRIDSPTKTFDRNSVIEKHLWPINSQVGSSYL